MSRFLIASIVAALSVLAGSYVFFINQEVQRSESDPVVPSLESFASEAFYNYSSDNLTGQLALITGGSTGIGRAVAVELYKLGCDVVITSRSQKRAEEAAAAIEESSGPTSGSVRGMALELANNANVRKFAARFKEVFLAKRPLRFLVENAGMAVNFDMWVSTPHHHVARVPSTSLN